MRKTTNLEIVELYKTSYKVSTSSHGVSCYQSVLTKECPLHSHDYYEVEWITEGEIEHFFNNETYINKKNDFWITDNHTHHRLRPLKNSIAKINNIRIFQPNINDSLKSLLFKNSLPLLGTMPDRKRLTLDIIFKMLTNHLQTNAPSEVLFSSLTLILYELFSTEETNSISNEKKQTASDYVTSAVSYINEHFKEDISLQTLADSMHLSPNYLCSMFSKVIGLSFTEYLNNTRLNHAKHLLATSNLSIIDVAMSSGFNSPSTMTRVFAKYAQITPKDYRKKKKLSSSSDPILNK